MRRTIPALLVLAALTAGGLAGQPPSSVGKLVASLRGDELDPEAWRSIVAAGKAAIPELKKLLGDRRDLARARAAALLYRLGEASALNPLAALLGSKDEGARAEAAAALRAFVGAPTGFDPHADEEARGPTLRQWKTWWQANRKDAIARPPMSRLYGELLAVGRDGRFVVVSLTARHGAAKAMVLTVRRGTQPVCSLVIVHAGQVRSIARIAELSTQAPLRVGDVAFFIRR